MPAIEQPVSMRDISEELQEDFQRANEALWAGNCKRLIALVSRNPGIGLMTDGRSTLLQGAIGMGLAEGAAQAGAIEPLLEVSDVNQPSDKGLTAFMMLAAARENLCDGRAFARALELGGDPQSRDGDLMDPLMHAAYNAIAGHVEALADRSNPIHTDTWGNTALILAADGRRPRSEDRQAQARCIRLLLPRWNVDAHNQDGATALSRAVGEGHFHCVKELWAAAAPDKRACERLAKERFQSLKSLLALADGPAQFSPNPGPAIECLDFLCVRMPREPALRAAYAFGIERLPAFAALREAEALAKASGISRQKPAAQPRQGQSDTVQDGLDDPDGLTGKSGESEKKSALSRRL